MMVTQQQIRPEEVVVADPANDSAPWYHGKEAVCIAKGQNSVLSPSARDGGKANRTKLFPGRKQSRRSTEHTEVISNNSVALTEDEFLDSSTGSRSSNTSERSSGLPQQQEQHAGCLRVRTQKKSLARRYSECKSSNSNAAKKTVSWDTIQINTHEVVLGDNPAVSVGPPLSIGWARWHSESLSIDAYEEHRPERRRSEGLRVPRSERERLLMQEFGVARSYMVETTQLVNKIKIHRRVNAKRGPLEMIKDAFKNRRSVTGRQVHEKP